MAAESCRRFLRSELCTTEFTVFFEPKFSYLYILISSRGVSLSLSSRNVRLSWMGALKLR